METTKLPFLQKLTLTLISIVTLLFIIYIGQDILIPLLMAFLFAILLRPIVHFFRNKLRFPDVLASITAVVIFVAFIVGIFIFLSYQITEIDSDTTSEYESKGDQWKMAFRAGKDAVETARSIASQWLLELK